jgi:hypothetical protein
MDEQMEKLKGALKAGKHVEIERHVAQPSATSAIAAEKQHELPTRTHAVSTLRVFGARMVRASSSAA